MSLTSGSLGSLLQGVNQQPDRVRNAGQVTEQINLQSDVTLGLSSRPSTTDGEILIGASDVHRYVDVKFNGQTYIMGYTTDDLRIWDTDGMPITVIEENNSQSYVGDNMRFHTVDDQIVVLNRDVPVAPYDVLAQPSTPNMAVIHALGGQFSKLYKAEITFSDGTVDTTVTAQYRAPDGDTTGDAENTTAEAIISDLELDLLSSAVPAGTVILSFDEALVITHPTQTISVVTSDGEAGEVLRKADATVRDLADLPRYAPNGMVVKVTTSEATEDDFYMQFQVPNETSVDGASGFGKTGQWVETYRRDEVREFDLVSMPHILTFADGAFTFSEGQWLGRPVGDEVTAPFPSIVGKTIRDVGGFEGRLVLLTNSHVVMSRTDKPFDLWRESATVVVATDPIDITSTKKDELKLDWLVPFDSDLYMIADPGDSQFVIRGGNLESSTASMVLTTEFEVESANAAPVSTGRTILLPFVTGKFSGVKEFYTDSDNAANAANTLTETQDRYIEGAIRSIKVSQNFNTVLINTDLNDNVVYVYKYLWDQNEILQSAWYKWTFVDQVLSYFFEGSKVVIVSKDADDAVFLHTMDLNRPLNDYGFHTSLDRQNALTVTSGFVTLNYRGARFMQSTGCQVPGAEVEPTLTLIQDDGTSDYYFDSSLVPEGAEVVAGQSLDWYLEPTQVYGKDYQQRIDTSQLVTIQDYIIHVDNSGELRVRGSSPYYSDTWEYSSFSFPPDGEPLDPERLSLRSGPITFPWGERADYSKLAILGSDIKPVTIHEVAWVGQILKPRGRRT